MNTAFTRFVLPAFGEKSALSSGFAYVADGTGGLQLVNFLQFDTGLAPPTIQLDPIVGDVDPAKTGLQFYEGSTVSVPNRITDDVQVRSVELLINGAVVLKNVSYPYELSTVLPKLASGVTQAVLQVRATDTGGNVSLSAPIVIDLVADTTPPTIVSIDPANNSNQSVAKRSVTVDFSEAIDLATVNTTNFVLHGAAGNVIPISVDLRQTNTHTAILYPPLTTGGLHVYDSCLGGYQPRWQSPDRRRSHVFLPHCRGRAARHNTLGRAGTGDWNTASNWVQAFAHQPGGYRLRPTTY